MAWKKGESGNPKGRPKSEYALSDMLRKGLNKTRPDIDGKNHQNKTILARLAMQAVATGQLTFAIVGPDDTVYKQTVRLSPREWMQWAEFIFERVEGSVPQEIKTDGGVLIVMDTPDADED